MSTKHETAIQAFLAERLTWQRRGLRARLNTIFDDAPIHRLEFIPDAFQIDEVGTAVRLLEVDGSSRMDEVKLRKVSQLWYILDCKGWVCELTTIHLVTGAISHLTDTDLMRHWHDYALA